jgi:LysR family hydrogen peroxide-inducible transcriptional activator
MELHQLRYFVAVAETGGFVKGAQRCGVTQPSLSQQIRKLENELGVTLFDRSSRGAVATEAGRALLPRAQRILAEVRETISGVKEDVEAGHGPLSVGAIPTIAPYLMPPVLSRFLNDHPECELTVREDLTERLIEAVVDHELDAAVMSTPVDHPALHVEVIGREPLLVVAPAGSPLPARLRVEDLTDEPAVVLHEVHCLGQQIADFCNTARLRRRIVCRSTQLPTVLSLVGLGLGVSIVPEMAAQQDSNPSRVYRPLHARPEREIAVVRRTDRSVSALCRRFLELLGEQFATSS